MLLLIELLLRAKRDEQERYEWQSMLAYTVEHAPVEIAIYDRDLRYLFVNQEFRRSYDVKDRVLIGEHHHEVFPEMPERWRQVHQRVLAGATERADQDVYVKPDGAIQYNRWNAGRGIRATAKSVG